MGLVELQRCIGERVRHGGSLDQVEEEIIDPAPLDENQKAALWLYAWTELPRRRQRAEVRQLTGLLNDRAGTP